MNTRRFVLSGLACAATGPALAAPLFQKPTPETPKAKVVPGDPDILDFGDGVRVPCNKSAFLTLWEGPTFWLTFGAGSSAWSVKAAGEARVFAISCMKALLLTLAFQPDRLVENEGHGWHLKVQDVKNYVRGDIELPGLPFYPVTDAAGGAGTSDSASSFEDRSGAAAKMQPSDMPVDPFLFRISAFMAYVVMKKDLSLDAVRQRAALIVVRPR